MRFVVDVFSCGRLNYTLSGIVTQDIVYLYPIRYSSINIAHMSLPIFIKEKRKLLNLTQQDLAEKAGVGLRFVRDLEQGKSTLRMDKVNQVLNLFGQELGPVPQIKK
jgi:y4mF family transcriptional regulator